MSAYSKFHGKKSELKIIKKVHDHVQAVGPMRRKDIVIWVRTVIHGDTDWRPYLNTGLDGRKKNPNGYNGTAGGYYSYLFNGAAKPSDPNRYLRKNAQGLYEVVTVTD